MQYVITTGLVAGIIHVVTGADHLIAMAPSSITRPKDALRNGLSWGLGHSSGVVFLSVLAIFFKDITHLNKFSYFAEFLVGISLLVIGFIAIKKSFKFNIHSHPHQHNNGISHNHLHYHNNKTTKHSRHSHALTSLGLLHGIAGGSHLLAVIPALALPIQDAFAYLLSYLFGSLFIMTIFTYFISISTFNAGQSFVKRLVAFAGGISFSMGLFWVQKSTILFMS
ncbi:MAG: hydantoin utilization protein A [Prochlorococcus sp. SP3034]|nr:hydantoin utilization protein A [Prochlorococcus sp. SP3034]